jgi:hypothetical protein
MKKQLLSISIASAIAFAGSMPVYAEDDDCVEVQTRFALANCLVESAVAIAAAAASQNGCQAGEWMIDAIVPEHVLSKIPIQGLAYVEGNGDFYELNGSSSAMLKNNVNCSVSTTASGNSFAGQPLTYATGSGNYYVDAIIEQTSPTVCISDSVSSGDIALGDDDYDENNDLSFEGEDDEISANGTLSISESAGKGQNAPSEVVSAWTVEEQAKIPELNDALEEAFQLEATTDDIDDCQIKVKADILNLESYVVEGESGGLTISGVLAIGGDDD